MSFSSKSSPKLAKAPFDDSRADIILRSKDNVNFRVSEFILSLISPVFTSKFTTAQPASHDQKSTDELPVITAAEDSKTLDFALRHCYPTRSPKISRIQEAHVLLDFAQKYEIDALEPTLTHYLMSAIETDLVRVFALAIRYKYEDVALAAARASLRVPISDLSSPEPSSIGLDTYRMLIRYHASCGAAASAVALERKWFPSLNELFSMENFSKGQDFSCCTTRDFVYDPPEYSSTIRTAPRYLWSYLHRSTVVLAHQPTAEVVTGKDFVLKDVDCFCCVFPKKEEMLEFSLVFGKEIERAIARVSINSAVVDSASTDNA
jgi:BTB/POZ domain-containing protein